MSKRRLTIALSIPLLVGIGLLAVVYGGLHTAKGASWIFSTLQSHSPGELSADLQGDLNSGLLLRNFKYEDKATAINAEQIRVALSLDYFPLVINVSSLQIQSLKLQTLAEAPAEEAFDEASIGKLITSLKPPIKLNFENLLINGLVYLDAAANPSFTASRVAADAQLHEILQLRKFDLEMDQGRFQLVGSLGLEQPFVTEAELISDLSLVLQEDSLPHETKVRAHLKGELSGLMAMTLSVHEPEITVSGTLSKLLTQPEWQLELVSPELFWPAQSQQGQGASFADVIMQSDGQIEDYRIALNGQIQYPGLEAHLISGRASGNLAGMQIGLLEISGSELNLDATADLRWKDSFSVIMDSRLQHLDPAVWLKGWPQKQEVSGKFSAELRRENLLISKLRLKTASSDLVLEGDATLNLIAGDVAARLSWTGFEWPLGAGQPNIQSEQGRVQLSGNLDAWKVVGDIDLESPGLPSGTLQLEATGNRDQANMTIVDGRVLGGSLSGSAKYDGHGEQSWSARLLVKDIRTDGLNPALPGMVTADIDLQGTLKPFQLDLNIHKLEGEIKNLPIGAEGRMTSHNGLLEFIGMQIHSSESSVTLNGSSNSSEGIAFTANIVELGSYLPHSSGSIQADGRLSLQKDNPRLQLDLEGRGLVWKDFSLAQISIHDSEQTVSNTITNLHMSGTDLRFGARQLNSLILDINVAHSAQSFFLTAANSELEFSTELTGYIQQEGQPLLDSKWSGQLDAFTLKTVSKEVFKLLQPAPVELAADQASIAGACLGAESGAKLCLDAMWQENGPGFGKLDLSHLPLQLIQTVLDTGLEMTQFADGELRLTIEPDQALSGQAMIRLSPGDVRWAGEKESLFRTGEGVLAFELNDGRLSAGNFDIPLPGQGMIGLDFSMSDVAGGLDSQMNGKLNVELGDLDILTVFVPLIDSANGKLRMNLDFSGTLAKPSLVGHIDLLDAEVFHEGSGLRLKNIQLSSEVMGTRYSELKGSFQAVEGTGQLSGAFDFSDLKNPRIQLHLSGEDLMLSDVPDLKLVAKPDIHLDWNDGILNLNGNLLIPRAHIAPSVLPHTSVSESPDLVIIAGELPGENPKIKDQHPISLRGELEVTLGDDVELDLSVAVAQVTGSTIFSWQDKWLPQANGRYSLVGQINAFGQKLQITNGDIRFPDVPANNPHLNIRAERQIYGNSEVRRAGVFVTGTVKRPVIEPYTDPMTNRDRAQTLLVTGSDFNMETGVGAVDIGTYIAPRIFVSYGIGVFEDENVINIRYDLGRNWGIKATSGQRQTGLDVSYTIDQ